MKEDFESSYIWKIQLSQVVVPNTFHEPDLVESLVRLYRSKSQTFVFVDGSRNILSVISEFIDDMLKLQLSRVSILKSTLFDKVNSWSPQEKIIVIRHFLLDATSIPNNLPIKSTLLNPISWQMVSMISSILGYDDDSEMDETTLSLMNDVLPLISNSLSVKFNFVEFFANSIHFQLSIVNRFKLFCYQSYMVYMLFYSQSDYFEQRGPELKK
jgi:hypothetical protein